VLSSPAAVGDRFVRPKTTGVRVCADHDQLCWLGVLGALGGCLRGEASLEHHDDSRCFVRCVSVWFGQAGTGSRRDWLQSPQ